MNEQSRTRVGVVGVGSMGENHARVYHHLPTTDLCGLFDVDEARAREIADQYDTEYRALGDLLETVDAVSVVVPTEYHFDTVRECLDAGVHVLVEKPFVEKPENGERLLELADERGLVLQVGHIERFNPAVRALSDFVDDLDIIGICAERLGPPVDRDLDDTAVMDLMIHDIDIVRSIVDGSVVDVDASGNRDARYAVATMEFDSGVVGQLSASRVTQQKVRRLTISAESCHVVVDYIDQSIEINRQSTPEYIHEGDAVHYHHEGVVEQLTIENREPLKYELESFITATRTDSDPMVSGRDGLEALRLARRIDEAASDHTAVVQTTDTALD